MALKIEEVPSQSFHQDCPWISMTQIDLSFTIPESITDKGVSCHELFTLIVE